MFMLLKARKIKLSRSRSEKLIPFTHPTGHPFKFSTTSNGTHEGGSEYTTGVTTSTAGTVIEVTR